MSERKEKFTPGPMSVVEFCDQFDIIGPDGLFVGRCANLAVDPDHRPTEEMRATAYMFAAAPELYEALVGVLRVADRQTVEFDAARAALAKARGEQ